MSSSDPTSDVMPMAKIALFIGISGATYIIGAHFYIHKFPECCKPGFFDIWVDIAANSSSTVTLFGTSSYLEQLYFTSWA